MADEELSGSKITEEIRNLRADTQNLNRPFYRKFEFWAVLAPVLALVVITLIENYWSPVSISRQQEIQTKNATLELKVTHLENRRTLLETEVTHLENRRTLLETEVTHLENRRTLLEIDIRNLEADVRVFEKAKTALTKQITELRQKNRELGKLTGHLRLEIHKSERALKLANEHLICREIDLSLRAIKDLAYSLGASAEQYNFEALASIALREGYLPADDAKALKGVGYGSWYEDWKSDVQWFKESAMDRSIAAQYVARLVVGSIDVGSDFSPFQDGTDADRDYPLSRLFELAIDRVENDEAKKVFTNLVIQLKRTEKPRISSLMPNVSNDAIRAVSRVKSNQVHISKNHLVEFAMEAIRMEQAHLAARALFQRVVPPRVQRRCRES